jgi:hypothetical protein
MIGSKSHRLRPMSDHSHAGGQLYWNSYKRHIPTTSPHHNFVSFLTITHCLPLWIKIDLAHSSHTQPFSSPRRHRERLYRPTLDDLDLESRTFKISPQTPITRSEPPQGPSSDTTLTASSSPAYFTWKSALLFIVAPLILTAIFTQPPSRPRRSTNLPCLPLTSSLLPVNRKNEVVPITAGSRPSIRSVSPTTRKRRSSSMVPSGLSTKVSSLLEDYAFLLNKEGRS